MGFPYAFPFWEHKGNEVSTQDLVPDIASFVLKGNVNLPTKQPSIFGLDRQSEAGAGAVQVLLMWVMMCVKFIF